MRPTTTAVALLCLMLVAASAGPAAAARRRAPPRRSASKVCVYCGMTRTKLSGMQPLTIMLGSSREAACKWDGQEVTLLSVPTARSEQAYRFAGGSCGSGAAACPKVLTLWGEKFHLNSVLDRCPATEAAATCRSYRRATAC